MSNFEDQFIIDGSDIPEQEKKDFEPLPDGIYDVRIDKAAPGTSQAGNAKLDITLVVIASPNGKGVGRLVFDTWMMPNKDKQEPQKFEDTRRMLVERLEAVTQEDWRVAGKRLVPQDLVGRTARAYLTSESYQGKGENGEPVAKQKNKVKRYAPAQATSNNPMAQFAGGNSQSAPASGGFRL